MGGVLVDQNRRAGCLRHQIALQQLTDVLERLQGRRRSRATRRRRWESRTVDRGSARHQRGLPQLEAQPTRRDLELIERALAQHAVTGTLQRRNDRTLVTEPHLALRRVHIDVDVNGVYREVE